MKKIYFSILLIFATTTFFAQIPAGYYDSATGKTGSELKTALYNIISSHNNIGYDGLWQLYKFSDIDTYYENDGSILDMYSENPTGADPYNYTPGSDQCGNYSGEGSCYNREHSFPKSWFNDASPMYSDAFHIYPTDGKVNGERSNWPYGEISNPSWTSLNGCKLGPCSYPGYTGTVFEPIDEFKGDLARTYFYMATCYENEIASWETNSSNADAVLNGTSYPCFEPWFLNMLLEWNTQDPVSQREIDRNNAIYYGDSNGDYAQGNRNPYIDHPEWVECIWNNNCAGSVENPGNLSATGVTTTEIDLSWNLNTNNDDILLAFNTSNTFGVPSGTYTAGDAISGGGTVLDAGNNTSFNHTGLSSQTYYYKLWSYDGTDYSSGITATATPLVGEPTNHVTNFTVSNAGATTIDLTWTDASGSITPSGYLVKANLSGSAITLPVDGQTEADATFVKNISSGIETVTFNGLNPNTSYDFEIFPYTNSGTSIDYKTDGTVPFATGTTTDVPSNCGNETFDGLTTGSSSYLTGSFTGQDGSTWNYTDSRTDQDLGNGAAICIRNGYLESGTVPNGINDITISTQRVYTGGTGDITVKVNNNIVGTVPYSDVLQTSSINGINVSGDIVLKFETPGTGDRVIIDDIIWTCNGSSPSNTLPEFTSTPVTDATAGQTYTYNITATDADDGDVLTFSASKPSWLTLTDTGNGTATLSGTPQNSDAGNNLVSISVSDGTGSVNQDFTIVVTAVNTLPEFTSTPITSATAGQTYIYNITATDADAGDVLTFSASKPSWLTLTDTGNGTATLSGTPQNSDAGNNLVSISVSDGTGSVNQDFTIVVTSTESVNSYKIKEIKLFPNPVKETVNIISSENIKTLTLKDILGKTVIRKTNINAKKSSLNTASLPSGIYIMEIKNSNNKIFLKKLIKK